MMRAHIIRELLLPPKSSDPIAGKADRKLPNPLPNNIQHPATQQPTTQHYPIDGSTNFPETCTVLVHTIAGTEHAVCCGVAVSTADHKVSSRQKKLT